MPVHRDASDFRKLYKKYKRAYKLARAERQGGAAVGATLFLNTYTKAPIEVKVADGQESSTLGNIAGEQRRTLQPNDMLLVIDMQNDFCEPPLERKAGDTSHPIKGNFYVAEGNQTIDDIASLISGFPGKVVASVDYHPPGHCSFFLADFANCAEQHQMKGGHCCLESGQNCSGPFPPHCIWGTNGAKLHTTIKTALDAKGVGDRVVYIHKGFHNDHDSFGAAQYLTCELGETPGIGCGYQCGRIIGDGGCDSFNPLHTGAYLLGNDTIGTGHGYRDGFIPNEPIPNELIPNETMEKYSKGDTDVTTCSFNDYLNTNQGEIGDIYVVGLAGDFCVLDTVRNLKQAFPDKQVYFVLNHTRFAWLPKDIIGDGQFNTDSSQDLPPGGFLTHPQYVYDMVTGVGAQFCTL